MKLKTSILICLAVLSFYAVAAQKKSNLRETRIEHFDIDSFRKAGKGLYATHVESKGDTLVERYELPDAFVQTSYRLKSPFKKKKSFYKDNLQLKTEANFFYGLMVGVAKQYNTKGEVVEQRDWDKCCPFSVPALISKLKTEFNIDLEDETDKNAVRAGDDDRWIYIVTIRLAGNPEGKVRQIKIDAASGATLEDKVSSYEKY
ncbi:MAG: PepSY domain-containing protein [Flavobacterium sp.]